MFQKSVSLADKSASLIIDWGPDWSHLSIRQKGRLVGAFQTKEELELGRQFRLPDGQEIHVLLRDTGLEVWHQGKDLVSDTASGQVPILDKAILELQSAGLVQLVALPPLIRALTDSVWLSAAGGIAAAAFLIASGFWVKRTGDKLPFWLAIGFCVIDLSLLFITLPGGMWRISILIALVCGTFIFRLYRHLQAPLPTIVQRRDLGPDAPLDSDI
jgi:hypothetical protein